MDCHRLTESLDHAYEWYLWMGYENKRYEIEKRVGNREREENKKETMKQKEKLLMKRGQRKLDS